MNSVSLYENLVNDVAEEGRKTRSNVTAGLINQLGHYNAAFDELGIRIERSLDGYWRSLDGQFAGFKLGIIQKVEGVMDTVEMALPDNFSWDQLVTFLTRNLTLHVEAFETEMRNYFSLERKRLYLDLSASFNESLSAISEGLGGFSAAAKTELMTIIYHSGRSVVSQLTASFNRSVDLLEQNKDLEKKLSSCLVQLRDNRLQAEALAKVYEKLEQPLCNCVCNCNEEKVDKLDMTLGEMRGRVQNVQTDVASLKLGVSVMNEGLAEFGDQISSSLRVKMNRTFFDLKDKFEIKYTNGSKYEFEANSDFVETDEFRLLLFNLMLNFVMELENKAEHYAKVVYGLTLAVSISLWFNAGELVLIIILAIRLRRKNIQLRNIVKVEGTNPFLASSAAEMVGVGGEKESTFSAEQERGQEFPGSSSLILSETAEDDRIEEVVTKKSVRPSMDDGCAAKLTRQKRMRGPRFRSGVGKMNFSAVRFAAQVHGKLYYCAI